MKRMILSLTLAAALCLSLVPGAGAAFTDIPDDTTQVAAATLQGLGVVSGTFGPDDPVTYGQVATVLLRTLGYTSAEVGSLWPLDYTDFCDGLGLSQGLALAPNDSLTRGGGGRPPLPGPAGECQRVGPALL